MASASNWDMNVDASPPFRWATTNAASGCVFGCRTERKSGQDLPYERDRVVRSNCAPFRAHMWTRFAAISNSILGRSDDGLRH